MKFTIPSPQQSSIPNAHRAGQFRRPTINADTQLYLVFGILLLYDLRATIFELLLLNMNIYCILHLGRGVFGTAKWHRSSILWPIWGGTESEKRSEGEGRGRDEDINVVRVSTKQCLKWWNFDATRANVIATKLCKQSKL